MLPCLVYCQAFSTPWFLYAGPTNHVTLSCVLSGLQHSLVPVRWTNQPCYLVLCTVRPSALPGSCTLDQPTVLPCLVYCQAFSTPWFLYAGPTNRVTLSCVLSGLQHSLVPVRWTNQPCYLVLCTVRPSALPGSCTLDQPTVLPCLVYCQAFSTPWFLYAGPTNRVTLSCVLSGLQHSLVPVRWTSQPCYLVLCTVRPSALPGSCTLDQPTVLPCLVYCQAFSTPWFLYAGPANRVTLSCVLSGLQHSLVPVPWTNQPCYLVLCTVRPSALPGSCTLDQPTMLPCYVLTGLQHSLVPVRWTNQPCYLLLCTVRPSALPGSCTLDQPTMLPCLMF